MSGKENNNYDAFEKASQILKRNGFKVISPHKVKKQKSWIDYMRHDIKQLMNCEAIAMLPGWEFSCGARLEYDIAILLKMKIYFLDKNGTISDLPF